MKVNRLDVILATALSDRPEDSIQYKSLDFDEVEQLFNDSYSHALEAARNHVFIYRGDQEVEKNGIDCVLAEPGNRVSENTTNIYTKLMSEVLPSWSKYPRRNQSFICSLDYEIASSFASGCPYTIFPKNNVKIGICSDKDLWQSFKFVNKFCDNMSRFNDDMTQLFYHVCEHRVKIPDFVNESVQEIKEFLDKFDNIIIEKESTRNGKTLAYDKMASKKLVNVIIDNVTTGGNTFDYLNSKMLNPTVNYFSLANDILEIEHDKFGMDEVWFSGECLMISDNAIDDIMYDLGVIE